VRIVGDHDARVDEYIDALPEWQQQICHTVRAIVHKADPDPDGIVNQGHGNATAKAIQIYPDDPIE
jgi:hypothetical protein